MSTTKLYIIRKSLHVSKKYEKGFLLFFKDWVYHLKLLFFRHSSQRERTSFSFLDSRPNTNQSYRVSI